LRTHERPGCDQVLRNEAKLHVLVTLDLSPEPVTIAELAEEFRQQRGSLYVYCARLRRQGLIEPVYDLGGRLGYQLTRRGRLRLAWLRRKANTRRDPQK
jgi:DNA-binding IclR family transcriptional regulator